MRRALLLGVLAAALLVVLGTATTPGFFEGGIVRWVGVPAVLTVLLAYGVAVIRGLPTEPLGFVAGGVYAAEIGLEYLVRPADNGVWGLVEFALVLALFVAAGARAGWRTGAVRPTALAGVSAAMTSALIFYVAVLATFLAFRGTAAQEAVLRAEGDYEDFQRAGGGDFHVFIMQDFLGAGFFHMLLSPLIGALLGTLGGVSALAVRRLRNR